VDSVVAALLESGFSVRLISFSALDQFCGLRGAPDSWVETDADLADLSRLFGGLRFPGPDIAEAAVEIPSEDASGDGAERTVYFRCRGSEREASPFAFAVLDFAWDAGRKRYIDPGDLYAALRGLRDGKRFDPEAPSWRELRRPNVVVGRFRAAAEAAVLVSRYKDDADGGGAETRGADVDLVGYLNRLPDAPNPLPEEQRILLTRLMASRRPDRGLRLLQRIGFVDAHWPELAAMDDVDHSKEFHPEGNAWDHTLETFRYRKIPDPTLSLGLLLHDVGKPLAESSGGRRFDRHAELGERTARAFLGRLGYPAALAEDVAFLVRNHMMPAALPRLPLTRTQAALESPLFPLLLELYRCDESSSFKDQGGFYESCAAYRTYLRNVKNPYRSADGKKLKKRLFS
jgi:poly(A) polymerase